MSGYHKSYIGDDVASQSGTVIHGTLNLRDLLPAFIAELMLTKPQVGYAYMAEYMQLRLEYQDTVKTYVLIDQVVGATEDACSRCAVLHGLAASKQSQLVRTKGVDVTLTNIENFADASCDYCEYEYLERMWSNHEFLDKAANLISEVQDELVLAAPKGMYFGAHWGDGSDFGWWPLDRDGNC